MRTHAPLPSLGDGAAAALRRAEALSRVLALRQVARARKERISQLAARAGLGRGDVIWLRQLLAKLQAHVDVCMVKGCRRPYYAKGLCAAHLARVVRGAASDRPIGPKPPKKCAVNGCGHWAKRLGCCWAHAKRKQRGRPLRSPLERRAA